MEWEAGMEWETGSGIGRLGMRQVHDRSIEEASQLALA